MLFMNQLLYFGLALGLTAAATTSHAQSVGVGTTTPNASAALDVQSTTQGLLVPRMTASQRIGISNAATGLLVYQTDAPGAGAGAGTTAGFYFYDGSAWASLSGSGSGTTLPSQSGNAGKALTTDGSSSVWSGYPVMPMTKATRDALSSPAVGQTVYQTDDYPGLYTFVGKDNAGAANSTGWRCMSGDGPVTVYSYGTITSSTTLASVTVNLDASQHTIYVNGTWDNATVRPTFYLPNPTTCKGRRYRFVVRNATSTALTSGPTAQRYGYYATILYNDAASPPSKYPISLGPTTAPSSQAGDGRATEVFSDGTAWYEILTDTDTQTQW
jgi:hypothetical protein